MTGVFSNIAIVAESMFRHFMPDLAVELRRRHGATIHLFCNSRDRVPFFEAKNADGRFESVTNSGLFYESLSTEGLDPDREAARARRMEEFIGCTYNTLAVADRHVGRSFALGGFYHPRSRHSENTGYTQMLYAFSETLEFWERQLKEKGITLVIGGGKATACVCRALGIPYRNLIMGRFGNDYHWVHDEFHETPEIETAYNRLAGREIEGIVLEESYYMAARDLPKHILKPTLWKLSKAVGMQAAKHLYWRLRGFEKAKGYYLASEVAFFYRQWAATRAGIHRSMPMVDALGDKPFVFFPLATEPETTMSMLSPEYFNQLGAIASLARDLPAGAWIAVKETPYGTGRRPTNFYDQIREFKNVVLLNIREDGLNVIRKAAAVATITGTAGYEAAAMGIPVVSFGRHNLHRFLPHVLTVTDEACLPGFLSDAVNGRIDREKAKRDGARFHRALKDISLDMGGFTYMDLEAYDQTVLENACRKLEDSLSSAAGNGAVRCAHWRPRGVGERSAAE